ncbi:A24 family peptidase [Vibrio atypicus]|uniref:A24 family peptidase n=1 Tax=Vibrio atypicus TaxID=558271 RepID=UPI00135AB09D|nr:A24 family peptidase [Vibrio atypicus]
MEYIIWFVLLVIAVSDAKEHRIPNLYLLITLVLCIVKMVIDPQVSPTISHALFGASALFGSALVLHIMKVMAPGDVKLLGVIGFWLGWGQLFEVSLWIAATSILMASFYSAIRIAGNEYKVKEQVSKYKLLFAYGRTGTKALMDVESNSAKLRMPFAPVVVIGVALHSYF